MLWLCLGVLLWSAAHLLKSVAASTRAALVERLGNDAYRGVFSLVIVASVVLMVIGWRATDWSILYVPPTWARHTNLLLMLVAMFLFAASGMPSNVKRAVRHPQLTGVIVWSVGHLLANGDSRSLVLFGGIGLWAVVSIVAINRRDGAWPKPAAVPISADLKAAGGGLVGYVVLYLAHPYLFGVAPM